MKYIFWFFLTVISAAASAQDPTEELWIPAAEFTPKMGAVWFPDDFNYFTNTSGVDRTWQSLVDLPHGARIKELRVFLYDTSGQDLVVEVIKWTERLASASPGRERLLHLASSGAPGYAVLIHTFDMEIDLRGPTNEQANFYTVEVTLPFSVSPPGPLRFKSVRVLWTAPARRRPVRR